LHVAGLRAISTTRQGGREKGIAPWSLNVSPAAQETIRRLWPADREAFRDHLLRLDPQSRHDRFSGGVSDDFLIDYAEKCFGAADYVFGAFVDGELRGAGELRATDATWREAEPFPQHPSAEAAFSVEADFRRRGIGEHLFKRILSAATNHGVETIEILCQADNRPMQRLAAKFKAAFSFSAHEVTGRLVARRPTLVSLWREAAQDMADLNASLAQSALHAHEPEPDPAV
jgi:GNAT superfamily N-acetyltransferase